MLRRVLSFAFATKPKVKSFSRSELSVGQYLRADPVSQQILMFVGRPGIGKSHLLDSLISLEYRSELSKRVFTSSVFNSPDQNHGTPASQIMTTVKSALKVCLPHISQSGKDEIKATLSTAFKDALALMDAPDELPKEMTQEEKTFRKKVNDAILPTITELLEKAGSPLRPAGINERELLPVLEQCSPDVIYEATVILVLGSLKEKVAGEITCPLLVSLLNTLSRSLPPAVNQHLPLLFVIKNLSELCMNLHSSQFVASLIATLARDLEHFNVIMEGYLVSTEVMKATADVGEKVLWQFAKPMAIDHFTNVLKILVGSISDKDASFLYEGTKADIRTAKFFMQAIKELNTGEKTLAGMLSFYVEILDQYFDAKERIVLGDNLVNSSLSQMSFETIRPVIYFISNLVARPEGSEMSPDDFYSNQVAQELCYAQICYYDLQTQKIDFLNELIRKASQHTKAFEILGGPNQINRNRAAYDKFLLDNKPRNDRDPPLCDTTPAHSLPYVSPYQGMMDYTKDKSQVALARLRANRKKFNAYPPHLQNTLFHGFMVRRLRKRGILDRVMAANELRQGGNSQYNKGDYITAANCYEQGLGLLFWLQWSPTEEVDVTLRELSDEDFVYVGPMDLDAHDSKLVAGTTAQLGLNLASAYMKLQYFPQARALLETLTSRNPKNHYVLARLSQCQLCCLDSTRSDLHSALDLINSAIKLHSCDEYTELISKVTRKIQDAENEERAFFVDFFKQVKSFEGLALSDTSADAEFEHRVMLKLVSKYPKMIQFYTDNEQMEKIPKFRAEMAQAQAVLHRMNWIEDIAANRPSPLMQEVADSMQIDLRSVHIHRAIDRSKRLFIVKAFGAGKYSNSLVVHCIEECAAEEERRKITVANTKEDGDEGDLAWKLGTIAFMVLAAVLYYCATPAKGVSRLDLLLK